MILGICCWLVVFRWCLLPAPLGKRSPRAKFCPLVVYGCFRFLVSELPCLLNLPDFPKCHRVEAEHSPGPAVCRYTIRTHQIWHVESRKKPTIWGVPKLGDPQNCWFISWKIPLKLGWWLGVPPWLWKPPYLHRWIANKPVDTLRNSRRCWSCGTTSCGFQMLAGSHFLRWQYVKDCGSAHLVFLVPMLYDNIYIYIMYVCICNICMYIVILYIIYICDYIYNHIYICIYIYILLIYI